MSLHGKWPSERTILLLLHLLVEDMIIIHNLLFILALHSPAFKEAVGRHEGVDFFLAESSQTVQGLEAGSEAIPGQVHSPVERAKDAR